MHGGLAPQRPQRTAGVFLAWQWRCTSKPTCERAPFSRRHSRRGRRVHCIRTLWTEIVGKDIHGGERGGAGPHYDTRFEVTTINGTPYEGATLSCRSSHSPLRSQNEPFFDCML